MTAVGDTARPKPDPIAPFVPVAPDSDFEGSRSRMQQALVESAGAWTDFNASDPGTTAMEAGAFAVADVHYRIASACFESWPAQWPGWLAEADRHWAAVLPAPSAAGSLTALANALRALIDVPGRNVEREVRESRDRVEAEALLARPPFSTLAPASLREDIVTALRWPLVRRVALESTDVVADAVDSADKMTPAAAADELELVTGLWREECEALVRRERRRRLRESLVTPLVDDVPESLEGTGGASKVWPPHRVQALPCEPVTAEDYATRARTHSHVKRAWGVRGRLKGIAWNGFVTPTQGEADALPDAGDLRKFLVPSEAAEAITIVVETTMANPSNNELRAILAHAVGTEAFFAFNPWRDNLDANDPRRLMCDEVGIAPLRLQLVRIEATLLIPPTANRAQVTAAAGATIDAFFEEGRQPDAGAAASAGGIDGPWPPAPQPTSGWTPGESIRLSEVVARIVAIPEVLAVRELRMRREGSSAWAAGANGVLTIPVGHIPRRSLFDCFETEFLIDGGCDA